MTQPQSPLGLHVGSGLRLVRRLLSLTDPEVEAPRELADGASVREQVAATLQGCGHSARLVSLDAVLLRTLQLPTLLFLPDAEVALVMSVGTRTAEIEWADGRSERVPLGRLTPDGGETMGLQRSVAFPSEGTFVMRVAKLLLLKPRLVGLLIGLAAASAALGSLTPVLTARVMDEALPDQSRKLLAVVAFATLLLGAHRTWLGWLQQQLLRSIEAFLGAHVARGMFAHVLALPFRDQHREGVGDVLETLQCVPAVVTACTRGGLMPLLNMVLALWYGALLASYFPALAAVVALLSLASLCVVAGVAIRQARLQALVFEAKGRQQSYLYEMLTGARTLQVCGASRTAAQRWTGKLVDQSRIDLRRRLLGAWTGGVRSAFGLGVRVIAFAWSGAEALEGRLTLGTFLAVAMLTDTFWSQCESFGSALSTVVGLRPALTRLDGCLKKHPQPEATASGIDTEPGDAAIVLDDVWFRYGPDQPWVLSGCNLRIPAGEITRLSDRSGAGKTSMLRLIAGLYSPERGSVRVFGQDPTRLHGQVGYLPQDCHLFQGSVDSTLQLLSDAPRERIEQAIAETGLDTWLSSLPMGRETLVSVGGGNLSGGQRQWIAMTGALASRRRLLLLDESMSQLDRPTRTRIARSAMLTGRTVVMVAHEALD